MYEPLRHWLVGLVLIWMVWFGVFALYCVCVASWFDLGFVDILLCGCLDVCLVVLVLFCGLIVSLDWLLGVGFIVYSFIRFVWYYWCCDFGYCLCWLLAFVGRLFGVLVYGCFCLVNVCLWLIGVVNCCCGFELLLYCFVFGCWLCLCLFSLVCALGLGVW